MKRLLVASAGLLLALGLPALAQRGTAPDPSNPQPAGQPDDRRLQFPAHYLVLEAAESQPARVVHYQRVMMSGPLETLDDAGIAAKVATLGSREAHPATVRLRDRTGRVVHQGLASLPRWQRVETLRPEGDPRTQASGTRLDGQVTALPETPFVVRVPVVEGASRLEIRASDTDELTAVATVLDLDAVESQFATAASPLLPAATTMENFRNNGSSGNRLDVLWVGEGYRAGDSSWFRTDTNALANGLISETPFLEYAGHINQWRLHVPSMQIGADRPACPGDRPPGGEDIGLFVDTAFDATYCSSGIWRLLTVNTAKVLQAAASVPDWDIIIVVVQSPYRGGSGGPISVTSLGPSYVVSDEVVDVMLHEFGHSFGRLGDEYIDEDAAPNYPPCSDTNLSTSDQCEPNVTDETRANVIKWRRWFVSGTPIPTTNPLLDSRGAGLWEGARYLPNDIYRQCYSGKMKDAARSFCRVDSEAILLRLYDGGWGAPASGIYTIEPGTRSPATSSLMLPSGQVRRLQARVLGPLQGGNLKVEWLMNNLVVVNTTAASGATVFYDFVEHDPGTTWTVRLRVTDQSSSIHSTTRSRSMTQTSWTITIAGGCSDCSPF